MCNFLLKNSNESDIPLQLHQDIERILISQTKQLNFIATNVTDPNDEQRKEILEFIEGLYGQYHRVLSENRSYIEEKIRNNPEIQRSLAMIMTIGQLSIRHQQGSNPAQDAHPTRSEQPPTPPPQPSAITFDDLPSRNDKNWMDKMWEKACKFISSVMEWLDYAYRRIRGVTSVN